MAIEGYITTLSLFVSGILSVSKLEKAFDVGLSELRQSPEMNPEKSILSTIDLYLHEMNEGLRGEAELYALIRAALDETTQSKIVIASAAKQSHR